MNNERPPRESATVMLIRDGADGLEVFMVRRHLNSDFVGGAYVFPGGSLDAEDCAPALLSRYSGTNAEEASTRLGLPADRALGHWGAAIRETFEEACVLLARRDGELLDMTQENARKHWLARRAGLLDKTWNWAEFLAQEDLQMDCSAMFYFAHWITPEGTPKRFSTRFFLAIMPAAQRPVADEREVEAGIWVRPDDALARHRTGEITLIFPTIRTLEELATFGTTADAVAACQNREVTAKLPRVIERSGEPVVLLPGDAGYDEAAGVGAVRFNPSTVRGT
jgi:8-oxo-dGTP pyrophosphatase MutT (NUDIX family)